MKFKEFFQLVEEYFDMCMDKHPDGKMDRCDCRYHGFWNINQLSQTGTSS